MNSPILRWLAIALSVLSSALIAPAQTDDFLPGEVSINDHSYPYVLLPPANIVEGKTYPLVLFLHGAGERGSDNEAQKRHFPERMASPEYRKEYPCFVLAPQCPKKRGWVEVNWRDKKSTPLSATPAEPMQAAIAALEEVVRTQPIDLDRISLTGLSMGGYGTWDLATRHPDWFSAAVPICGGGDEKMIARLAGLPMQVWHGGADEVVPTYRSKVMVDAAQKLGFTFDYHELPGVGHFSWGEAYGDKSCLNLLFASKRDVALSQTASAKLLADEIGALEHVAFLGDSITQAGNRGGGYVDLVRTILVGKHKNAVVIPAGISGHKVPDLLARFHRDVINKKATLVFLYIGINDVWHSQSGKGTPAKEFEAGLRTLIREMKAAGSEVVLATPSVIGESPQGTNALDKMLDQYAAISRKVAAEENLILCDLRRAFFDHLKIFNPSNKVKGVLTSDGVHLNAAGNQFLANQAARALRLAVLQRKAKELKKE